MDIFKYVLLDAFLNFKTKRKKKKNSCPQGKSSYLNMQQLDLDSQSQLLEVVGIPQS